MDHEILVKKVTDEVIKALGAAPANAAENVVTEATNKNLLVLITGASNCQSQCLQALSALSSNWRLTLCASAAAEAVIDLSAFSKAAGNVEVIGLTHEIVPELISRNCFVVALNLTLNTLSLVSDLASPTAASNLIVSALAFGRKVVAVENFLIPPAACPPASFCARVDELKAAVASYGVSFVNIDELANIVTERISGMCDGASATCSACGQCIVNRSSAVSLMVDAGAARIGAATGITSSVSSRLSAAIDHTLLKPDATHDQIIRLCEEAKKYSFASVCVNPSFISLCRRLLKGTPVKVCTVIGFPLGATSTQAKAFETRQAVADGAEEIDMVINVGALKSEDYRHVEEDIRAVRNACPGKILKVILETALLTEEDKIKACTLAKAAGADFVKTSTGFGPGGATVEDIALMRRVVGPEMGVKASGGVRDRETVVRMIDAGATRIGASASVAIVKDQKSNGSGY